MLEVVFGYVKTQKIGVVREIHWEILNAYERDFAIHAPPNQVMKIITVWKQVHSQLAKENKKFVFSALRKSAKGKDFEEAIQWLCSAGLIYKNYLVKTPLISFKRL